MKPTPQQRRSRETVERLLTAANDEFGEVGVSAATTTSIAERAGVSVGSLYRFFGDKVAIAQALSEQYLDDAIERFGPIVSEIAGAGDVVPAVRAIVRAAADLQITHAGYYRITEDATPDTAGSPASGVRSSLVETFAEVLERHDVGASDDMRREVVGLLTETVRHTLSLIDPVATDRDRRVAELEELAVGYLAHRFGLAAD